MSKVSKMIKDLRRFLLLDSTIREINLEFVNYCNLRCKWCSLDHTQKRYVMSEELLRKVFDNLLTDKRFRRVESVLLWNAGETLCHPHFVDILRVIKEYKGVFLRRGSSFPAIILLTNGVLLNKELSKELVDLGVLDAVRFSIDGGSKEKYEEIRRGARWDTVSRNVRDFVDINHGKTRTGIICIIEYGKKLDMDWMSEEFKGLLRLVNRVELRYPHDWIGNMQVEGLPKKIFLNKCRILDSNLVILPNGDVTVCCNDTNGKGAVGNLYNENLFKIYRSKKRLQLISYLKEGRKDEIGLCKNCSAYQ